MKQFQIRQPDIVVDMYDQLISTLKNKYGTKTNRQQLFREWVETEWAKECGEHFLDLGSHVLFFLTEKAKEEAQKLIREYQENGMVVDEQIVGFISERSPAYTVRKSEKDRSKKQTRRRKDG